LGGFLGLAKTLYDAVKRICLLVLMVIIVNLSFTACQLTDGYNKNAYEDPYFSSYKNNYIVMDKGPVKGGTLKIFSTDSDTLNPLLTQNIYVQNSSSFLYEGLVGMGKDQKPVPVLAEGWEVSDNGLVWTFHIRDGILWHDDTPLTAEDVEFTFEVILNANMETVYKSNLQNVATFAAVDRSTFRLVLRKPNSFTAELLTFPILPKHCSNSGNMASFSSDFKPVGTGPFRFKLYNKQHSILLVANDKWWNSKNIENDLPDFPYIDEIEIRIYDSVKDEMSAFQSGDVDMTFIESTDYNKYYERSDLIIKKYTGRNFEFLSFNTAKSVLSEKSVRQAVAYALNRQEIIGRLLPGKAISADIPVIPGTWLYDSNINSYTADISKARGLLSENGWREEDGKFYRIDRGTKKRLELEILVNTENGLRNEIAEMIKTQLSEAGIGAKVTQLPWDEEFKRIKAGKYDLVVIGCRIPVVPDMSFLYSVPYLPMFSSTDSGAMNISAYYNPELPQYIEKFYSEMDYDRRKAIFLNMKNIIIDEVPYLGLFFYTNAVLCNKNIRGDMEPHIWNRFNDIAKWYIPGK